MSKPYEPPERIWLQTYDEHGEPNDPMDGTVTWCEDRQDESDTEYVRGDVLKRYRAALAEFLRRTPTYCRDVCNKHGIDPEAVKEEE